VADKRSAGRITGAGSVERYRVLLELTIAVGGRPGEPGHHLVVVQAPHLARADHVQ
jgi:hypothetical protein